MITKKIIRRPIKDPGRDLDDAGGTATKDISALDLVNDIKTLGKNAYFVEDRNQFLERKKSS